MLRLRIHCSKEAWGCRAASTPTPPVTPSPYNNIYPKTRMANSLRACRFLGLFGTSAVLIGSVASCHNPSVLEMSPDGTTLIFVALVGIGRDLVRRPYHVLRCYREDV